MSDYQRLFDRARTACIAWGSDSEQPAIDCLSDLLKELEQPQPITAERLRGEGWELQHESSITWSKRLPPLRGAKRRSLELEEDIDDPGVLFVYFGGSLAAVVHSMQQLRRIVEAVGGER